MKLYYTDGSAHPNPGPGGFGVVEVYKDESLDKEKLTNMWYKKSKETTNNRMELSAINFVMQNFSHNIFDEWGEIPTVYSDSAYAINTFNDWMFKWAKNNWRKANNEVPENLDIIKEYFKKYISGYRIDLKKIQGHNGDKWNCLADSVAKGEQEVYFNGISIDRK